MYYELFNDIPIHVQYHVHLLIFNKVVEIDCTNAYFVAILLTITANLFYKKTTWRRGPWRESWRVYWGLLPVPPPTAPRSRCLLTSYPPTWLQTSCLPCQTLFSLSLTTSHHCWCSLTEVCRLRLSIFSEGILPISVQNFICNLQCVISQAWNIPVNTCVMEPHQSRRFIEKNCCSWKTSFQFNFAVVVSLQKLYSHHKREELIKHEM